MGEFTLTQKSKIVLVEAVLFGLIAGALFGLFVEYNNYIRGNIYWENKPENFYSYLSTTIFGTFPVGIFIGYVIFGLVVALFVYALARRTDIKLGKT